MTLLAKPDETLLQHTLNVIKNAENEKEKTAGIFHDTGKATRRFQNLLRGKVKKAMYRHEILSAIIYLHACEKGYVEYDEDVLYAVATHHKDINSVITILDGTVGYYADKQILTKELEEFFREFYPGGIDLSGLEDRDKRRELLEKLKETLSRVEVTKEKFLLRGKLRQLDHIASFLHDFSIRKLDSEAMREYFETKGWTMKNFQKRAYESNADVLIIEAPTGHGKTEASLLYADKFLKKGYRIHYVINNKASLNAMFDRLVKIYGEENTNLLYSNVAVKYYEQLREYLEEDEAKNLARSLAKQSRYMLRPVKLTTIHTLYKLTHNDKNADIILAEINKSAIIIDEVQMLDREYEKLLDTINYLLKFTNAKLVITSATIPDYLISDVEKLARASGKTMEVITVTDERKLHYVETLDDELTVENIERLIREKKLKNVLVVVNTVGKAIELYKGLKNKFGRVALLHSRFKVVDRARKEREVIANFNDYDVIITTQVVEASVDVSAEAMVTELAPSPSLVQRLGRVNRHSPTEPEKPNVYVFLKVHARPYKRKELEITKKLLRAGKLRKEDERKLAKEFYKAVEKKADIGMLSELTFEDYLTRISARTVEDGDVFVMLTEDDERLKGEDFIEKHKQLIPVSKHLVKSYERVENGYFVVAGEYDEELGLIKIDETKGFEIL